MSQPVASSSTSTRHHGHSSSSSGSSKRKRDPPPDDNDPPRPQSGAIHQGTSRLMALMQQEQAAVAAAYQERINALAYQVKIAQDKVDYLTQVHTSGNDLLATRAEFQRKLDDSQTRVQEQHEAYALLLEAVIRNGLELVTKFDASGRKLVDLRFNGRTREVISKFFQLPGETISHASNETSSSTGQHPTLPLPARQDDLSPLQFFGLLQTAVEHAGNPSNNQLASGSRQDVVMQSVNPDIPHESTRT